MGFNSIWHWLVVLAIVLLLFGTGRVSTLMGDLAKGVKAFKKGLNEADDENLTVSPHPVAPKTLANEQGQDARFNQDDQKRTH